MGGKKPSITDEQKRQAACKAMEGMAAAMTATGVDFSADPSTIDKAKVATLCATFKKFKEKAEMFAKCSAKNQQLVAGARKICAAGGTKPDGYGSGKSSGYGSGYDLGKKPSITDEQKRQAACKAMEGMAAA